MYVMKQLFGYLHIILPSEWFALNCMMLGEGLTLFSLSIGGALYVSRACTMSVSGFLLQATTILENCKFIENDQVIHPPCIIITKELLEDYCHRCVPELAAVY